MLRLPVVSGTIRHKSQIRLKSSNFIRNTFIEYFVENHGHKFIKSSSVVPLCDPTVPFVNAGMNQFKGVFLGTVEPPCPRAVNSQKCVRVGGKHNDLELVGMDGHHHTFFEMLGNWSFGDYYKKEACRMAWDLLLGPYRLKPEDLVVTYFSGDAVIGLQEDRECRDIWKSIGVPPSRIVGHGARDNFWEMGASGPCGPCTEIHYVHPDGTLTEIWNIVFIQCNREADGRVSALRRQHVDTGLGLERAAALLQGARSNYDTDLFTPLLRAIHQNSAGVAAYGGSFGAGGAGAALDQAYRRLADHARMVSVCLADGVYPATSLNLKQIMRKSFKICTDVFHNPELLSVLYDEVVGTLGEAYPELAAREKEAKLIMEHERESYAKLRATLKKKWKKLVKEHPEVEALADIELAGFPLGYKEFKETMAKHESSVIPGELVFKLYDTHGFQEDVIERIATLNSLSIDKPGFWKLLSQHKARHKTALKEQTATKGLLFDRAVENLVKNGVTATNDQPKYNYLLNNDQIQFSPVKSKLVAILNEDAEWIDYSQPSETRHYYLVTESTNFYCEEGGQAADVGFIVINEDISFQVDSVFKIRDFVFHKGQFSVKGDKYISRESEVTLTVDSDRRISLMRNHTAVHLLNAAVRKVLPRSVVCQAGSSVTDTGLSLQLTVYGEKLSQAVVSRAQELVRESIQSDGAVQTRVVDSLQLAGEGPVVTVPGEAYPETGLRIVSCTSPALESRELCCGTHVPSAGRLGEFCVTLVKGAGGNTPLLHALTGDAAREVHELYCRAEKLSHVVELADRSRVERETQHVRERLQALCGAGGAGGAPAGQHAAALQLLDSLRGKGGETGAAGAEELALHAIAKAEVEEALSTARSAGRPFVVHFLRCSYLMQGEGVRGAVRSALEGASCGALVLGCAGGVVVAAASVPEHMVSRSFCAARWLRCVLPVFGASALPASDRRHTFAEMSATKVSLITCEQMVQDAMRAAIAFAKQQLKDHGDHATETRQHN